MGEPEEPDLGREAVTAVNASALSVPTARRGEKRNQAPATRTDPAVGADEARSATAVSPWSSPCLTPSETPRASHREPAGPDLGRDAKTAVNASALSVPTARRAGNPQTGGDRDR